VSSFPERRLRRLRRTPALRRMVAETQLSVDDLVAPLFVREGLTEPHPIESLPGVVQHTVDSAAARPRSWRGWASPP
jgi:porphobilinogen synthase